MDTKTKKLTVTGLLCALAYIAVVICQIPVVLFLKYEPKDVIITLGGLIYGPWTSFVVSLVVSFIEMFTISTTGYWGCIMNILSTCTFACTAAFIYKKNHTLKGAITGLIIGSILMVIVMILWNWIITPIYMGYPREAVAEMLIPVFLPFNCLKAGLNSAFTFILYKPIIRALRKSGFIDEIEGSHNTKFNLALFIIFGLIILSCILFILILNGTI